MTARADRRTAERTDPDQTAYTGHDQTAHTDPDQTARTDQTAHTGPDQTAHTGPDQTEPTDPDQTARTDQTAHTDPDQTGGSDPSPRHSLAPPLYGVLVAAGLVIAGAGVKATSQIIGPTFLVLTLVITVQPLRVALTRHRVPSVVASLVALLSVYALLAAVIGSVVWSLTQLVISFPTYGGQFTTLYNSVLSWLNGLGISTSMLQNAVSKVNLSTFTALAQTLLNTITSGLSLLALMVTVVVFLAFDAASIEGRIDLIRQQRPHVADALVEFSQSVRKYWIVSTVFGLIVAVIDVIALLIIGVPLAVTWGVLSFVTNYIPNIGFILGLIPPTLIALLEGGVGPAIAVVAAYCVINVVIQTLIQPRFTGDAVGITATVAFLSLILWAYLLGGLGAILAIPATLLLKVFLVDNSAAGGWFGALIDANPADGRASEAPR